MRVIDVHTHLDLKRFVTVQAAVDGLAREAEAAGLTRAVVLPLGLDAVEVQRSARAHERLIVFACVHPSAPDCVAQLERQAAAGCRGLKLHPRVQGFTLTDDAVAPLLDAAGALGLPVLIDCFPWGNLDERNFPLRFDALAKAAPRTTIVMAHAGGIRLFDAMMVAKSNRNVYLDISFSLLYFRGASLHADLGYVVRSVGPARILYGSDHPDRPLDAALRESVAALEGFGLRDADMEDVLYNTAAGLLAGTVGEAA